MSEVICDITFDQLRGRQAAPFDDNSFVSFNVNCTFVSEHRGIAAESLIVAIVSERTERAITRVAHLTSAADQWERAFVGGHLARPRFRVGVAWLATAFSVYADCRPRLTGCLGIDDFHAVELSVCHN